MWRAWVLSAALVNAPLWGEEACGRVATVNHQKILVDTSSIRKGEGLRYLLEKDAKAKAWLARYQRGGRIRWENALMGTLGGGLLLGGFMSGSDDKNKESFLVGGVALLALNFLVVKTQEQANEAHLRKAIEEYNRRNLPKIYLGAKIDDGAHIAAGGVWEF